MATLSICGILIINLLAFNPASNAYELFSIGCQLELEGKIQEAINYYLKALQYDPTAKEVYLSLASAFYRIREFDKGIEYASKGLAFVRDSSEFYGLIAAGYIGKGDLKSAVSIYEKIKILKPSDPEIVQTIALLYEGLGDLNSALKTLIEFPDSLKNVDIYNRLGTLAGKLRNHPDAIKYYRQAYNYDTTNVLALIGIGTGFDILNVKDSAIYYYELALKYSDSNDLRKRLIDLYGDTEQYEKIIKTAREILGVDYYDAYVRRSLGFALYKSGLFDEALSEFLISAGLNPRDDYSRFYIARINLEQRRYDEAEKAIEDAIKINPDFTELWVYAGFIAMDKKDYKTARYYLTEAAYHNADMSQIYYLLGATCELDSAYTDAYFYYKKSLSLNQKSLAGLSALANICDRIGKKDEALRTFERIIQIDSTDATALNYVGYTYAERGEKLDYALELVERALSIEPNNGYIIDSRGWVYYQKGDYNSALLDLKRASELVEDAVIFEHLGDVYLKLNEFEKAIEMYNKVLNLDPKNKAVKHKLSNLKGE
uniref:Tetratricopeptide repeat protein n=1 Tax=candidate division WOR-3 bacterium TaxID=2052148 RepID=A0A7C6EGG9_UNCW3